MSESVRVCVCTHACVSAYKVQLESNHSFLIASAAPLKFVRTMTEKGEANNISLTASESIFSTHK